MEKEDTMPILRNYSSKPSITLSINLHKGKGFIFETAQEDYQNWISYNLSLSVAKNQYVLEDVAFSLEGLKCFLRKMQFVVNEKSKTTDYDIVSYCGSKNEFEVVFQNTDDYFEDEIVHMQVWINSAYLSDSV